MLKTSVSTRYSIHFFLNLNNYASCSGVDFAGDLRGKTRMKNSVSDQSFYIESEDEEEVEKLEYNRNEEDKGNEEFYASFSSQRKNSSYATQWPQSYRSFLFSLLCFSLFHCSSEYINMI